jgi:hypothetical protein
MTSPLTRDARIHAELRERLKAEYGLEDGEETLEDTLQGATYLIETLAKLAREVRENEALSEAIGKMQKEMAARAARLESRAQNLRVQIAWAMQEAGLKRIPADVLPEMTVTMSGGRAPLIIPDDDAVPELFCRIKKEPDRTMIRRVLQDAGTNAECDWAFLGNPQPALRISTK